MKNFIVAYNFLDSDVSFIANHFEIVDTYLEKAPQVQQMKAINPKLKAIYYRNAISYWGNEPWVVLDAEGNKIVNDSWGFPLANIGNSDFRTYLASEIKAGLDANPMFDGVFLDNVQKAPDQSEYSKTIPSTVITNWQANMLLLLQEIKAAIGAKLLIINTSLTQTFITITDGMMDEAFGHAGWQQYGESYNDAANHLAKMAQVGSVGKIFLAQSGIVESATPAQISETELYCRNLYLSEANETSYYYFATNYQKIFYLPEWDQGGTTMQLRAKWYQNPESDMKEYKLYRTDAGKTLIATIAHPLTEYLFSVDVTGNGTLKFVLTAVDTAGLESAESDPYNVDYGETPPPPPPNTSPGKPTGFVVEIVTTPPPSTNYALSISDPGARGSITLSPIGGIYASGTVVTVTATANSGSMFQTWSGDLTGNANPANLTMDGNKTISAVFVAFVPPPPPPSGYRVDDFNIYPTNSDPKPAKGVPYVDPLFPNITITRITDAPTDVGKDYCQCGYPKHDIENADGTMLIIQSNSDSTWHIWNANPPYNLIQTISYELIGWGRAIDCRWDAFDPDLLYFTMFTAMYKYRVSTKEMTMLYDFTTDYPTCTGVSMNEEGTPSEDSRYWAFCVGVSGGPVGTGQWWGHLVCYDKDFNGKDKGKIITDLDISKITNSYQIPGFSSMSPSGKYVWTGDAHYIYPRDDFSKYRDLLINSHADMALSKEGREVIAGFGLFKGMWSMGYWALMADIETGLITYCGSQAIGLPRYHFSGNAYNTPGWSLMSGYATNQSQGGGESWADFELVMFELTARTDPPSKTWRLAKTRGGGGGYNDASFGKLNKRGTKVWFGSRWGGGSYDVYQIDLPKTWYKDLG